MSRLDNSQSSLAKNEKEKEAMPKRKNSRNKSQSSNKSRMLVAAYDRQNSSLDSFKNAMRKKDCDTIFPIGIMQDRIINNQKSQPKRKKSK